MFSSIVSASKAWIVFLVLGFVIGIVLLISSKKRDKKKNDVNSLSMADEVDSEIKKEEDNDMRFLNSFFNDRIKVIYNLYSNKKCVDVVNKYFEINANNRHNDFCEYILPKEYINRNIDEDDYIIKSNRICNLHTFLYEKRKKLTDAINHCVETDVGFMKFERDFYNYLANEVDYLIDVMTSIDNNFDFDDEDYLIDESQLIDEGEFFDEINDFDLSNYSDGIDDINTLYLGLNGLGCLNNCSLEIFYMFVGFKQEEYNTKVIENLCSHYAFDYEETTANVQGCIFELEESKNITNTRYLLSHPNSIIFELINNILSDNGKDDINEFLVLIIRHSSNWNYDKCIKFAEDILCVYHKTEKAKVKASNFINGVKENETVTISDVDSMNGVEFEGFVAKMFDKLGYTTEVTKASGDQGVDVIAKKDGKVLGIQAKCYSGVVGNHAIMEVVAGMNYYECNCCMVVTNSVFTAAAKELARANHVELWERNDLKEQMELLEM